VETDRPYLRHLLGMEIIDTRIIRHLFKRTQFFLENSLETRAILDLLHGRFVASLFFEPSTRTRVSFEVASRKLGAFVLSPNMQHSATVKGESLLDTIHVFEELGVDIFVVRHPDNNTSEFVASELNSRAAIINAGDGNNQHPSQALLDLFTIYRHKKDFTKLSVAIIGDIAHSRVARSLIEGLRILGTTDIRLVAPKNLLDTQFADAGVSLFHKIDGSIDSCDVVMTLRLQRERMDSAAMPDPERFFQDFGLTAERLAQAKADAIVMHPGPLNRGIEIASEVADGPHSVILEQIRNGCAMRMALLETVFLSNHYR